MCQKINDACPDRGEQPRDQNPDRIPKRREIEFSAAVCTGADYDLRPVWCGYVFGIALERGRGGRRRGLAETCGRLRRRAKHR